MHAAPWPRSHLLRERLLVLDPARRRFFDDEVAGLPARLSPGDLLVVNDAGTLPASLRAHAGDVPVELRLAAVHDAREATAVLLGDGDWRTDTDLRAAPPRLSAGDTLALDGGTRAAVVDVSAASPRLVRLHLGEETSWLAVAYASGRPVQYAYMRDDLPLGSVQTPYAAAPWAVEMPSAGRALSFTVLRALVARGVRVARLTHAAGLSATGDPALDAALPLPERYALPEETVRLVAETKAKGGRVIAVGTTVVRALEGCVRSHGTLVPGEGVTDLVLDADFTPRVADGVLSGMHDPGSSHARLLAAFAPAELLDEALRHAEHAGYLVHEFGDHLLVLPRPT